LVSVIRIGLLDSGTGAWVKDRVLISSRFELGRDGAVRQRDVMPDTSGHGSGIARIVAALASEASIVDAQVFNVEGASSPAVVAAGLDWLIRHGVGLVNMSFGLLEDRAVLRLACERALGAGAVMLAATPARGRTVFPAAYPGVIRISADGRCSHREMSALGGNPADFGACPLSLNRHTYVRAGGTSYAVAHATGIVGAWMSERHDARASEVRAYLASIARYSVKRRETAEPQVS
jgi:Subtilase family